MASPSTILFSKPYGTLSQFTRSGEHAVLADFGPFPPDVYPVGRLDADSEGLLLLTNDSHLLHRLTDPKFGHERTYLVQVEGIPDEKAIRALGAGVVLDGRSTRPALVRPVVPEPDLPPRPVPIRFRRSVPTSWLEVTLTEGRNRQVRRMTAAVGHPTLRLVRTRVLFLTLEGLAPGEWRPLKPRELDRLQSVLGPRPSHPRTRPARRLT